MYDELDTLFQQKELHSLDMVSSETEFIEKCRAVIEDEADRLLQTGLGSGNQTTIAAGLQIFYNMKQLGDKVNRLTNSLLDDLTREIRHAVDMSSLQKEIRGKKILVDWKKWTDCHSSCFFRFFFFFFFFEITKKARGLGQLCDEPTMNRRSRVRRLGHLRYGRAWKR